MSVVRIGKLEKKLDRLKLRDGVTCKQFEDVVLELLFLYREQKEWLKLRELADLSLRFYKSIGLDENTDYRSGIFPVYGLMFGIALYRTGDKLYWERFISDAVRCSVNLYFEALYELGVIYEEEGRVDESCKAIIRLMSVMRTEYSRELNVWSNTNDLYSEEVVMKRAIDFGMLHFGNGNYIMEKYLEEAEKYRLKNGIVQQN